MFLPTAMPYVIISPSDCTIHCSGLIMNKQCRLEDPTKPIKIMETKVEKCDHKKNILVITDSSVGNVFARKFIYQPPSVSKMK